MTRAQEKRAERDRKVMALHAKGLSQNEIADRLDMPRATIQSIIRRVAAKGIAE
jgi:transposase